MPKFLITSIKDSEKHLSLSQCNTIDITFNAEDEKEAIKKFDSTYNAKRLFLLRTYTNGWGKKHEGLFEIKRN